MKKVLLTFVAVLVVVASEGIPLPTQAAIDAPYASIHQVYSSYNGSQVFSCEDGAGPSSSPTPTGSSAPKKEKSPCDVTIWTGNGGLKKKTETTTYSQSLITGDQHGDSLILNVPTEAAMRNKGGYGSCTTSQTGKTVRDASTGQPVTTGTQTTDCDPGYSSWTKEGYHKETHERALPINFSDNMKGSFNAVYRSPVVDTSGPTPKTLYTEVESYSVTQDSTVDLNFFAPEGKTYIVGLVAGASELTFDKTRSPIYKAYDCTKVKVAGKFLDKTCYVEVEMKGGHNILDVTPTVQGAKYYNYGVEVNTIYEKDTAAAAASADKQKSSLISKLVDFILPSKASAPVAPTTTNILVFQATTTAATSSEPYVTNLRVERGVPINNSATGAISQTFSVKYAVTAGTNPVYISTIQPVAASTSMNLKGSKVSLASIADDVTTGDTSKYFYVAPNQTKNFTLTYTSSAASYAGGDTMQVISLNYGVNPNVLALQFKNAFVAAGGNQTLLDTGLKVSLLGPVQPPVIIVPPTTGTTTPPVATTTIPVTVSMASVKLGAPIIANDVTIGQPFAFEFRVTGGSEPVYISKDPKIAFATQQNGFAGSDGGSIATISTTPASANGDSASSYYVAPTSARTFTLNGMLNWRNSPMSTKTFKLTAVNYGKTVTSSSGFRIESGLSNLVVSTFGGYVNATTTATTTTVVKESALTGLCAANNQDPKVGQSVYWQVSQSGGAAPFTYTWSGTDSLTGSTGTVVKSYATAGVKTATVTITSPQQSITKTCSVTVSPQTAAATPASTPTYSPTNSPTSTASPSTTVTSSPASSPVSTPSVSASPSTTSTASPSSTATASPSTSAAASKSASPTSSASPSSSGHTSAAGGHNMVANIFYSIGDILDAIF